MKNMSLDLVTGNRTPYDTFINQLDMVMATKSQDVCCLASLSPNDAISAYKQSLCRRYSVATSLEARGIAPLHASAPFGYPDSTEHGHVRGESLLPTCCPIFKDSPFSKLPILD